MQEMRVWTKFTTSSSQIEPAANADKAQNPKFSRTSSTPEGIESVLRSMLGYNEQVMDNISLNMFDIYTVFLEPPTPENVPKMQEVLLTYTMTFNHLQRLANEGVLSDVPPYFELQEWAAIFALSPNLLELRERFKNGLLLAALLLLFLIPEVYQPKPVPEEWQLELILSFNYIACIFLLAAVILTLAFLDAESEQYLPLEKFVFQIKFYVIIQLIHYFYYAGLFCSIVCVTFSLCAHLDISLGFTVLIGGVSLVPIVYCISRMQIHASTFEKQRSELFCEMVCDQDSLMVKQEWSDSLRFLANIDNNVMGGNPIPPTPRKDSSWDERSSLSHRKSAEMIQTQLLELLENV